MGGASTTGNMTADKVAGFRNLLLIMAAVFSNTDLLRKVKFLRIADTPVFSNAVYNERFGDSFVSERLINLNFNTFVFTESLNSTKY